MATLGTKVKPHIELLVEDAKLQILEEKKSGTSDRIFVRGEFGSATKPTLNKRLYPPSLWEAQIERLTSNLSKRKMIGQVDHPDNGKSSLGNTSHVVTALKLREDGIVEGEAEILNTRAGKDLQALLRADIPVGVSSRGYGSTKQDGKNEFEVVQDDYKLITFDFVADPADPDATPAVFYEHVEDVEDTVDDDGSKKDAGNKKAPGKKDKSLSEDSTKEKELSSKFTKKVLSAQKEGAETAEAVLRNEFAEILLAEIAKVKEGIRKEVTEELMRNPEIAAAKKTLDVLKSVLKEHAIPADVEALIAEKDSEITQLKNRISELEESLTTDEEVIGKLEHAAREAGYRYQLEKLLRDDEDASIIRSAVGDVTEYASIEELEKRVEEVRETISESQAIKEAEYARSEARHNRLEADNAKLEEALEEALKVGKQAGLELYLERRLRNHPQADKIRAMFAHSEVSSKEQVDALLETYRVPKRDSQDLERIRSGVRKRLRSTSMEHDIDEETRRRRPNGENYNGLGASLGELRHLAGVKS